VPWAIAGGDPGDIGQADDPVRGRLIVSVVDRPVGRGLLVRVLTAGWSACSIRARLSVRRSRPLGLVGRVVARGLRRLRGRLPRWWCRAVAAQLVQRQDRVDAVADRFTAGQHVGAGGAFLELADLGRHSGGELLTPAGPRERLVVQEQQGAGGVALETAGVTVRVQVEHDTFVAEADAEVLQASVATPGLRQDVVQLVPVDGGGVTARGPQRGFVPSGAVVVVENPPVGRRVAQLHRTRGDGASFEVLLLALDVLQLPGLVAAVLLADQHLHPCGKPQEAGVEVAGDPVPAGVGDARRRLGGVVALVLAEQHDFGCRDPGRAAAMACPARRVGASSRCVRPASVGVRVPNGRRGGV
jgi:hypothetical protein